MKVNEIFVSLQGEGHYTGTAAVFLRLSGCNLACPFCDTQHRSHVEMTEEEIVQQVSRYTPRHLVITGGEPSLQLTESLVARLHAAGFYLQVETNGTRPLPQGIDWITCSPKVSEGGRVILREVSEVKMLFQVTGRDPEALQRMYRSLDEAQHIRATEYRLQPLDTGNEEDNRAITQQTIHYIIEHPTWKLSLQTHKILNVR